MSSSSSSLFSVPRTPTTPRFYKDGYGSRPLLSSPLAPAIHSSSPGPSLSPVVEAQARRRSQYKSTGTPYNTSSLPSRRYLFTGSTPSLTKAETPQSSFLRERLKAKCLERARRSREKNIQQRRASEMSSDGFDVDMDASSDKDDDEDPFDDEIFRRIIANEKHKREYAYRVSFEQSVGSSFDPGMEDITEWERPLEEEGLAPPDDIFEEEDDEYWAARYEELYRDEQLSLSNTSGSTEPAQSERPNYGFDMVAES